mgnify:CR=1 FL=1
MQFCSECDSIMLRNTADGRVRFICKCGNTKDGGPGDLRVGGSNVDPTTSLEMYDTMLRPAANDPINQKVKRKCLTCGLDYMTVVRVTTSEIVIFLCKCGRRDVIGRAAEATAGEALRAEAAATAPPAVPPPSPSAAPTV